MAIERPKCEFRGAPPHPAKPAYLLVWRLPSGDVTKFSCAGHRFSFGGSAGYWVNRVECYEDNKGVRQLTDEPVASSCEPVVGRLTEDKPSPKVTCGDPECGNPAPYDGAWCDSCQSKWEAEQRAKAAAAVAEGHPRAINQRRGF